MRNKGVTDRDSLIINAGKQKALPVGQNVELSGHFLGKPVKLGDLITDEEGRLVVLGGHGESGSVPPGAPEDDLDFANNPAWHDDVSDGPVTATIEFEGAAPITVEPAWVVVAPPSYAPRINSLVTWYDQALNAAIQLDPGLAIVNPILFKEHIYPIIKRTMDLQWVSPYAKSKHSGGRDEDFYATIDTLSDKTNDALTERRRVFESLTPATNLPKVSIFSAPLYMKMPYFRSGVNPEKPAEGIPMAITEYQYDLMRNWSEGNFVADWDGNEPVSIPFAQIPDLDKPKALDRAALDACVGGPFCPGIECGYPAALSKTYDSPFRISDELTEGDFSAGMAVPWQADFKLCSTLWWPAQRPNMVTQNGSDFHDWTGGVSSLVTEWAKLNFIIKDGDTFLEKPN